MKLVIFDIEGVVFDDYYVLHVAKNLGLLVFFKFLLYSGLYKLRVIDIESAIKKIYRSFKGASKSIFTQSYRELKVMDGWTQTAELLRQNDCKIAFVSIGFPTFLLRKLARETGTDPGLVFGVSLVFKNGYFSGDIKGKVTTCAGKAVIVEKLAKQLKLSKTEICTVSNDRNNACMFEFAGLNIGFKPDLLLRSTADVLVGGKDIELILPHLIPNYTYSNSNRPNVTLKREALRQGVHLLAFMSVWVWIISPTLLLLVLTTLTVAYIFSESLRMDGVFISPFSSIVQRLARKDELHLYAVKPLYLVIGILVPLLLFPSPISYVAVTVLTFGDSFSTLIGIRFGRHHISYNKSKSIEGSVSGFIAASIMASLFISPFFAIVAALSGMIIESLPLPINDNISIPLSIGIILSVLSILIF